MNTPNKIVGVPRMQSDDWRQYRTINDDGTITRVFRGPNGWYVATEDESGTHYQPSNGGQYASAKQAWEASCESL